MTVTPLLPTARALASGLPPLLLAARRLAAGLAAGSHGRRRAGPGEVFWQYRAAQAGDPASTIDWRRSARSDHLYVREREWMAARTCRIWRDGTNSMHWTSASTLPTKTDRAGLLLAALAVLLGEGGESIGLLSESATLPRGRIGLERLAHLLERGGGGGVPSPHERSGTVRVLAGDFLDAPEATAALMTDSPTPGVLLRLIDPAELSLPYGGRIRFEGLEGEAPLELRRVQDLRPAYARKMAEHGHALAELARQRGWALITHRTDKPPLPALAALMSRLSEGRRS